MVFSTKEFFDNHYKTGEKVWAICDDLNVSDEEARLYVFLLKGLIFMKKIILTKLWV